jgi:hypothetical protein
MNAETTRETSANDALPEGLRIKGIQPVVRQCNVEPAWFVYNGLGTRHLSSAGEWQFYTDTPTPHFWPTRAAAIEACYLFADLPEIGGRQPVIVKVAGYKSWIVTDGSPDDGNNGKQGRLVGSGKWKAKGEVLTSDVCAWPTARDAYVAVMKAATPAPQGERERPDAEGLWTHRGENIYCTHRGVASLKAQAVGVATAAVMVRLLNAGENAKEHNERIAAEAERYRLRAENARLKQEAATCVGELKARERERPEADLANVLKEAAKAAESCPHPKPIASLHVSAAGNCIDLSLDTSQSVYSEWIPGEGGDIGLKRIRETNRVNGADLPLYAKTLVVSGDKLPTVVFDLDAGKVSHDTAELTRLRAERDKATETLSAYYPRKDGKPPLSVLANWAGNELERLRPENERLKARLDEIDAGAQADADDLKKMRDGTKLTRAGLVQLIVYQQQDIATLRRERDEVLSECARRNHGASGLCCQLRLQEKDRADRAEAERDEARRLLGEAQQKAAHENERLNATIAQAWSKLTGWDAVRLKNGSHTASADPAAALLEACARVARDITQEQANELQDILRTLTASGTALVTSARELRDRWEDATRERDQLRTLASQQRDEIERLNCLADAVECLRDIGRQTGCDHVDDPDGRRKLVNCVEEVIAKAAAERDRLRDRLQKIEDVVLAARLSCDHQPPRTRQGE